MTIYDIAKLAGVSKSTVSRVLNGEENVSDKSRMRVEKVIRECNYIPNRSAAMTKKKREVILVLVTRLDSYSETRLIRGMMEIANDDTEFLIVETLFSVAKTKKIIENNKNVNAIIVFAISGENYQFLDCSLVPVVLVGQKIETQNSNLYFPDYQSMYEIIQKKTIKRPLFLGFDKKDKTMVTRYRAAADALGQEIDSIQVCEFGKLDNVSIIDFNSYDTFICATETIALTAYKEILKNNLADYQIISVGNNKNINFIIENFSTIDFHYKASGSYIMKKLIKKEQFKHESAYTLQKN